MDRKWVAIGKLKEQKRLQGWDYRAYVGVVLFHAFSLNSLAPPHTYVFGTLTNCESTQPSPISGLFKAPEGVVVGGGL